MALKRALSTSSMVPTSHGVLRPNVPLNLMDGGILKASDIAIHYASWGHSSNPIVYIAPSVLYVSPSINASLFERNEYATGKRTSFANDQMSQSCFVTHHPDLPTTTSFHGGLWWRWLVGPGPKYPINTDQFHVISFTPLGSPFGSTSPRTHIHGASSFPTITPRDQAQFIKLGLDCLGINQPLHCIIGGSMGGMQVLEFAAQFPSTYHRLCAIATTGWTSPSTVALRSIQRKIVRLDPRFEPQSDAESDSDSSSGSALEGLLITRMIGTICYRSRVEFDDRFDWNLVDKMDGTGPRFEVERYLEYQGNKFAGSYDANCYLTLSQCMDRMNMGAGFESFEEGVMRIPSEKDVMLISYDTDYLIPPQEMQRLSAILGSRKNSKVYYECLQSIHGHDSFMVEKETKQLDYRLRPFLQGGVKDVERVVAQELS